MSNQFILKPAKLYIFDMDGTILDSMPAWEHLGRNYLLQEQITPPDNLEKTIEAMTLDESAVYFQQLGLHKETDEIIQGIMSCIQDAYRLTIPAKPGMVSLIQSLSQNKDSLLCLLTTSEEECARLAMERLGIASCFSHLYTSSQLGLGKNTGEIYQKVCERYQISPSDTVVLEDALYAVRSAKEAGCYVYGIPDGSSKKDWEKIVQFADDVLSFHP